MSKVDIRRKLRSADSLLEHISCFDLPWANDYITESIGEDRGPDPLEDTLFSASKELMTALRHILKAQELVKLARKKVG